MQLFFPISVVELPKKPEDQRTNFIFFGKIRLFFTIFVLFAIARFLFLHHEITNKNKRSQPRVFFTNLHLFFLSSILWCYFHIIFFLIWNHPISLKGFRQEFFFSFFRKFPLFFFLISVFGAVFVDQGMGEPLHNVDNVIKAASIMVDEQGLQFSPRKVTVSTSGLVPQLKRFLRESTCAIAVSLNATTDEVNPPPPPNLVNNLPMVLLSRGLTRRNSPGQELDHAGQPEVQPGAAPRDPQGGAPPQAQVQGAVRVRDARWSQRQVCDTAP